MKIMPASRVRDPRWFDMDEAVSAPVSDFDIVLMRKDPRRHGICLFISSKASRGIDRAAAKACVIATRSCSPPVSDCRPDCGRGIAAQEVYMPRESFSSRWTGWVVRPSFGQAR